MSQNTQRMATPQEAFQASIDAMKRTWGHPPAKAKVGIDFAKDLFKSVATKPKMTEAEFLKAIEKGEVMFNKVKLEAGWV